MTTLSVVGVEEGQLVLVSPDGQRFLVDITEALTDALRRQPMGNPREHKTGPKDIQAHIRRGLSAQQVADLTGEELSYIKKFEGAVVAEREFVIEQALSIPVTTKSGQVSIFRISVAQRLEEISATGGVWSAWKEELGWRVELVFFEGDVEHRARWSFDPRKQHLEALNEDAQVLSRHEAMPTTLIPKLQAVAEAEPERTGRFDSQIFEDSNLGETGPLLEPVPYGRSSEDDNRMADTADLLEVLRRKRGEREPLPEPDSGDTRSKHPSTGGIRLVENYDDDDEDDEGDATDASVTNITGEVNPEDDPTPPRPTKNKRPGMPSWDDIVFGAKGDDDTA